MIKNLYEGDLDLSHDTGLATLPDGLSVGGGLDLRGCTALCSLPDGLSVGGDLDLSGCTALCSLPDGLSVGGGLDLSGCETLEGSVHNCGDLSRTVAAYRHPEKGVVVSLGCFVGTLHECEGAIRAKYSGEGAEDYINKVREAFAHFK